MDVCWIIPGLWVLLGALGVAGSSWALVACAVLLSVCVRACVELYGHGLSVHRCREEFRWAFVRFGWCLTCLGGLSTVVLGFWKLVKAVHRSPDLARSLE